MRLPRTAGHVWVPPIKCQGIKTKLVGFIFRSVMWDPGNDGRWLEPFLGSGVVAFNLAPSRAVLADSNEHIIRIYRGIRAGQITRTTVRECLEREGALLSERGSEYYYEVRARFNSNASPLDFLFLNRSCFNGLIRFNRKGEFNVPFGHKPDRFSKAYISKIANQVGWVATQMRDKDWDMRHECWQTMLSDAQPADFVYIDPPYIGRHTDYYNSWSEADASDLARLTQALPCGYAVSMWLENRHRRNDHVACSWPQASIRTFNHFYHVGSTEDLRNEMLEALLIKPGFEAPCKEDESRSLSAGPSSHQRAQAQLELFATA